jgi:hypothetical protein
MSLSKSTLSAIQIAGQGLHQATVVVSAAVQEQAEHMVATVASQPFQAEGEQAFANFRLLARLSQDLLALEQQLRQLYATAAELASPEMDVVASLPHSSGRSRAADANDKAEDAVVKPAVQRRAPTAAPSSARKPATTKGGTLTSNDKKVLDYLKKALKAGAWTDLTGVVVAQGADMPLGSVGVSLKKVVASGAVKKKGRSSYQLAR